MSTTRAVIEAKALERAADELNQSGVPLEGLTEETQLVVIAWLYDRAMKTAGVGGFVELSQVEVTQAQIEQAIDLSYVSNPATRATIAGAVLALLSTEVTQ